MKYQEIAKFIKKAVNDLYNTDGYTTYNLPLDSNLAIKVGWSGGFDEEDKFVLHSKSQPSYCVSVKIAENIIDEYEWCYMPYENGGGDVYDTGTAIAINENYYELAKWLNKEYREIRKMLKSGELTLG